MNNMFTVLNRLRGRAVLVSLTVVLLCAKLVMGVWDSYQADQVVLETRKTSLARYRTLTARAPELRLRLEQLTAEQDKLGKFLFSGPNEESILSGMQLDLQALVTTAGLEAETIRPIKQKNEQKNEKDGQKGVSDMGEVVIKANVNGTLDQYLALLAELFSSGKLYRIEAVTLAPRKKSDLKIGIDLRGYFVTTAPVVVAATEGAAPAKSVGGTPVQVVEGGGS